MATVSQGDSEAQINAVNQAMRAQPWYQQYLASLGQSPDSVHLSEFQRRQLLQLAEANGAQVDADHIEVDPGGNFNPKGHKLRNSLIALGIGGAAALTGGAALGAFGGAGAAGAGASVVPALGGGATVAANLGAASALPALGGAGTLATLGGGTTLAANLGSASALPSAGGGSMGLWDSILGKTTADKIHNGLNLAGNVLQSRQVSNATQAQTDAANRALELQSNVYQQQRSDLAPYRNVGGGAISDLARMTGTTPAGDTTIPAFQQQAPNVAPTMRGPNGSPAPHDGNPTNAPVVGQAMPRTLATMGGSGFVNMISPDGRQARVPQAQVQQAIAAGGKVAQ